MFNRILVIALALVVVFSFAQVNVAKAAAVTDGLVSYWTFDAADRDGNILKDAVGPNDGTINGNPAVVPGKVNEAFSFVSDDDYIDCGADESLKMTSGLTVECWVYWEGECSPIAGIERSYRIWIYSDDQLYLNIATTSNPWSGWFSGYLPTPGQWMHLAMVYDGSNLISYADGVKTGEEPKQGDVLPSSNTFIIGTYLPPRPACVLSGMLDELRVYNRGLSQAEILQNMAAGVEGSAAVSSIDKLARTWGEMKVSK
jgi:hypothetical protein